jgi:hypothetical protein
MVSSPMKERSRRSTAATRLPWIVWMRDNRHVVFFREAAGDENWRAWRVDLETGDVRPLTRDPG